MANRFVVVDLETANPNMSSICQVGIVTFEDGTVRDSWSSLVNPEDEFDPWNVAIHGIDEQQVERAPRFPELVPSIHRRLNDATVVVSHSHFDRVALLHAHEKYRLLMPSWQWLDTTRVARRAWPQFAQRGYSLANLAAFCGVEFRHHHAEEDARAAGLILNQAIRDTGHEVLTWVERIKTRITPKSVEQHGDPDGHLAGEVVVFTGALTMPRREIAERAAQVGCTVEDVVTKATTILVVGQQDLKKLAGHTQSTKHRKAEQLREKGQQIQILGENDFLTLARLAE